MNNQWLLGSLFLFGMFFLGINNRLDSSLSLSSDMALKMGNKIWHNECGGKAEGLTSWNEGEEFASLGIGHFIWYPQTETQVFKQTFPDLLLFFQAQGVQLPSWLLNAAGCPWASREEFIQAQQSLPMQELRQLLLDQIPLQVRFIVERMQNALPKLIVGAPENQKKKVASQFYRLVSTPLGMFALIDYINFKGEGLSPREQYQGEGWGLLQVLENMEGNGQDCVPEFIAAAKRVLERRVGNSPPQRNEKRWLSGWYNRLDGYISL